jgi:DNA (cytosine-5)-methyltransferase 1
MVYYNEIDPYAAQWLRNLIAAGHIARGEVDERSIQLVDSADLADFAQCHFFAGIGVWSHALRLAGWPDDKPVWTGSCPCQPFSAAGKRSGFDDERHLWPDFFRLIRERHPSVVFGEQVASKDGLDWLDLVQADLEGAGYASAAADLCAAGVGAPHIRQRLYWVGYAVDERLERHAGNGDTAVRRAQSFGSTASPSKFDRLADTISSERSHGQSCVRAANVPAGRVENSTEAARFCGDNRASTTNGFWRDADWLYCRDGKWRPVEPGTFPLAHGAASRVGRLRAYGNAIVPQVAQAFIEAFMECRP